MKALGLSHTSLSVGRPCVKASRLQTSFWTEAWPLQFCFHSVEVSFCRRNTAVQVLSSTRCTIVKSIDGVANLFQVSCTSIQMGFHDRSKAVLGPTFCCRTNLPLIFGRRRSGVAKHIHGITDATEIACFWSCCRLAPT